ncbi:MAG: phosphoribosylglycinamide formyltransferase [Corynebacterium sp.]|nr:phosphoribosylglycinamide formyltransferase [Corynebacterium sp.]
MVDVSNSSSQTQANRVVILVSGTGTLLQALIDAAVGYEIIAVVSDKACPALDRTEAAGIPSIVVPFAKGEDRAAWDAQMLTTVRDLNPDLVVSAGFMRILGAEFVHAFTVINTHPALLPSFPGAHAVRDALAYGVKITGTTVHRVDEGVDTGPIIAQRAVPVEPGDTEESLHERIKIEERQLIVEVIKNFTQDSPK